MDKGDSVLGTVHPAWSRVYERYQEVRDYKKVASDLSMNYNTVRGYVSKYRALEKSTSADGVAVESVGSKLVAPVPTVGFMRPYPQELTDWSQWQEIVARFQSLKRPICIVPWPDPHYPDQNDPAVNLELKVIEAVQPDLVPFTGDVFDFDLISRFDPPVHRVMPQDLLCEARPLWQWSLDSVEAVAKGAEKIVLPGNHDDRRKNAAQRAIWYTIEQAFVNLIRQDGRALWLGQKQEVQLDTMLLQHGRRVGENAAKNSWKDLGFGLSHVQGHNHRLAWSLMRQSERGWDMKNYRLITAASTGCLCNIPPAYQENSDIANWVQGTAIIHVYPDAGIANVTPIPFHPYKDGLMAFVGDKVLTV